jgi:ABC-2 type transport system permease protein
VKKEFRQISRDRIAIGLLIFFPAFFLVFIGYALNFDVKHLGVIVYDEDRTVQSRQLVQGLVHSEQFEYIGEVRNVHEIDRQLEEGFAKIALVIPDGFAASLTSGKQAEVQVIIDGSNSNTGSIASGFVAAAFQDYSMKVLVKWFEKRGKRISLPLTLEPRFLYNPDMTTTKYLLPGLFGLILMIVTVIATSLSIVREKEQGTMEQLRTSPLHASELIVGKIIPYLIIGLVAASLILLLGYLVFNITVKGSLALLYLTLLIFLAAGLGQGLLISAVAPNQQVAFLMSVFSSLLPSFLLSGFVFPIKSMPIVLQIIASILPVTYFLKVLRMLILKGVGFQAIAEPFAILIGLTLIILMISSIRLRKEMMQ